MSSDQSDRQAKPALPAPFLRGEKLPYTCGRCRSGGLILVDESFHSLPTAATRDARARGYLDPESARDRFSCLLRCSNPRCEDIVACVGEMHQEEDWTTGDWNLITVFQPILLKSLGGGRVATHEQQADISDVASNASEPDASAPIVAPVRLDPTDETILSLLAEAPRDRVTTPQIAQRLQRDRRSIGKNLSKLRLAGLIDNAPRKGYRVTEVGIARAPKR